ncbi:sulfite exporter TauE/SafE family protein [Sphingomonas sp. ASV193]|uniref:sulfite exporter TauE/SafE family protein n=1 Tax=Sphingomonas sp. ASV193 TaxID=3144405 RepID=UPI0032E91E87
MWPDAHWAIAAIGGGLVGFSLALVGGGGSILAVPILVYAVGIRSPHLAIGTSAFGVAANAAIGLVGKARDGAVRWRPGLTFAAAGVAGAALGSVAGKAFDGQRLLALFALLMILVGALMLRRGEPGEAAPAPGDRRTDARLLGYGFITGVLSGFFGIGGGFLIVPGLMAAAALPIFNAMATSLVAVTALGLTTAASYALSGLIDWPVAIAFVAGGLVGSLGGRRLAKRLAARRGALTRIFAGLIFAVAAYMLWKAGGAALGQAR